MKKANLLGQKFGRLTVIKEAEKIDSNARWVCLCECGNTVIAITAKLKNGHVKSCGCYRRDIPSLRKKTHGETKTRLYQTWCHMKQRCYYKKTLNFERWGGRGITVCPQWKNSYEAFRDWALSNGYKDGLSIDRIDNDKGYSPDNCRFATRIEQCRNKSTNFFYKGKTLAQWSEETGISQKLISYRKNKAKWDMEKVLHTPVRKSHSSTNQKETV